MKSQLLGMLFGLLVAAVLTGGMFLAGLTYQYFLPLDMIPAACMAGLVLIFTCGFGCGLILEMFDLNNAD